MERFFELLFEPLRSFWEGFITFVPNVLAMIIIIGAGIFIGLAVKMVLMRVLGIINYDRFCEKAGLADAIKRAQLAATPSAVTGRVVFWFIVIVFVMMGFSALGVTTIERLITDFFLYLPRVFSAALILFIGYVIAGFASRAVLIAAVNKGYHYSKLIAESVRILLVILVLAMALEQLSIAPGIVIAAFSIVFGGIVLALSIAFGVGGIEIAKKMIEKGISEEEDKQKKGRDIEHI